MLCLPLQPLRARQSLTDRSFHSPITAEEEEERSREREQRREQGKGRKKDTRSPHTHTLACPHGRTQRVRHTQHLPPHTARQATSLQCEASENEFMRAASNTDAAYRFCQSNAASLHATDAAIRVAQPPPPSLAFECSRSFSCVAALACFASSVGQSVAAPEVFTAGDAAWNTTKALSAGAFAGALSRTITSPLERLKVLKQVQSSSSKYDGVASALMRMYREEGLRGYWRGNGTNVARIAPFSAIQFVSFDIYKGLIIGDDAHASFVKTFTAGALTGMTASTLCYPLDLVRSVLSVQTSKEHYAGIASAMRAIVKNDGLLGLYRGLGPTLMGIAPYIAINMVRQCKLMRSQRWRLERYELSVSIRARFVAC